MKIIIVFTILSLTLFIFGESLAFGETGRIIFPVVEDTFDECFPECKDNSNERFLESLYFPQEYINFELIQNEDGFEVTASVQEAFETGGVIFLKINVIDIQPPDLSKVVKISKAELRFLALPILEGEKGGYSGKLISSLFLCNKFYEPSPICGYKNEPLDIIVVSTEELPKFLSFDITSIIDNKTKNSETKELFFAIESNPIEDLNKPDIESRVMSYYDLILDNSEEIFNHDYGVTEGDYFQIEPANIPEIFLDISDQPVNSLYYSKSGMYLRLGIDQAPADFFMIPSIEYESLSPSSIIIDYEILDSELSKAFTYLIIIILPTIGTIIPAVIWITRKTRKSENS